MVDQTPNQNPSFPQRYSNVERDEATLGVSGSSKESQSDKGWADEEQPIQRPPESIPEPRPASPVMNSPSNSSQSTNTNSPA